MKKWNKVTKEEREFLIREYENGDIYEICEKLNRSRGNINCLARRLGLKRKAISQRKCNLIPLLSGSLQSFYWLGYLAADGYLSTEGKIELSQAIADKDNASRFARFVNGKVSKYKTKGGNKSFNKKEYFRYMVSVSDKKIVNLIREMWGLGPNDKKTYSSISYDFLQTENDALAFFVGFFDGDGSRNKKSQGGEFEIYFTWKEFIKALSKKCNLTPSVTPSRGKYIRVYFTKKDMYKVNKFIEENKLEVSKRKWENS